MFSLCYYPRGEIEEIKGSISAFVAALINIFYPRGDRAFNFESTGISVPNGYGGVLRIRAPFGGLLADEKALCETVDGKGPSSKKPCPWCSNCVGRCNPSALRGSALVHHTSSDFERLRPLAPEELVAIWDELHAAKGTMSIREFEFLTMKKGFKYNPHGLQRSLHIRRVAEFPRGLLWDWMHNVVASGGIAQYEVGQFIRRLIVSKNITFDILQGFSDLVVFPGGGKSSRRLSLEYKDRIKIQGKKPEGAKMQFANSAECIQVIIVLQALAQRFLVPRGIFPQECKSLSLLGRIIQLLRSGDKILGRLSLLEDLIKRHHVLFKSLYPKCCKPKLHYISHTPDVFRRMRGNWSCFTPERKHRWAKRMAAWCFKGFHRTLLVRLTRISIKDMGRVDNFKAIRFEAEPTHLNKPQLKSLREMGVESDLLETYRALHTPHGTVCKGDVVRFESGDVGVALLLFCVSDVDAHATLRSIFFVTFGSSRA